MVSEYRHCRWCSRATVCMLLLQAIWAKGYTELLNLMEKDARSQPDRTHVDCFGYGDDLDEVRAKAPLGRWFVGCGAAHSTPLPTVLHLV